MGRITMRVSAGEDAVFAPGALDGLIGTDTKFNGQSAKILAARVLPDGMGELTLESDAIGSGSDEPAFPPGSFSFRQSDDA